MAVGDIYQNTVVSAMDQVQIANVLYQELTLAPGPDPDQDAIVQSFIDNVIPTFQAVQSINVQYECVLSRKVFPLTAPATVYPLTLFGDEAQASLPANQTFVVSHWSQPWSGANGGRYFLSGVPKIWVTEGRLQEIFRSNFDALLDIMTDGWTDGADEYRLDHFSKSRETFDPISNSQLKPVPTKLRNRTKKLCSIS